MFSTVDFTIYQFPKTKNPDDKTIHVSHYEALSLPPETALSTLAELINTQKAQAIGAQPIKSQYATKGKVYTDTNAKHFRKQSACLENHIQLVTLDLEISKTLEGLPGYEKIPKLRSVEEVKTFMHSLKIQNFLVTKSASHMRGENDYKWHIYFVLDRPVTPDQIKKWLWHRMPLETWVRGLSKDGRSIKTNSMIDLSIFNPTMTSHEYAHKESPVVYLQNGVTSWKVVAPNGSANITEPYHRPMYSHTDQRLKSIKHRRSQPPALRRHMKHIDKTGTIPPDFMLYPNHGEKGYTAQEIKAGLCKYKNFRDPYDPDYVGGPVHHKGKGVFFHYRLGLVLTVDDRPNEEVIRYDTKYAPLPDKLEDENCLIISETGSGKTWSAQKWKKSIFLVPTKALQRDIAKHYPEANIMRSSMDERSEERDSMQMLSPFALNVMTYDKLYGFITTSNDISILENYNIVVDEVHKLVKGNERKHEVLYKALFKRDIKFGKLCLLSATVEPSILKVPELKVYRYISRREYTAKITKVFPYDKIQPGKKTFIYNQSTQKNAELLEVCRSRGLKAVAVRGGDPDVRVDVPEDIETYDVIIGTSTIDVGVSFTHHIDTVIVDNVKGAVGLAGSPSDMIQIISRVRNNTPDIYIKHATTHFGNKGLDPTHPDYVSQPLLANYLMQAQNHDLLTADELALLIRFREQLHLRATQRVVVPEVKKVDGIEWTRNMLLRSTVQYTELGTINYFLMHESRYLLADWEAAAERYWKEGRVRIVEYGPQNIEADEVRELEARLKGVDLPTYNRHQNTRKGIEEQAKACMTFKQLEAFLSMKWDLAYYQNLKKSLQAKEPITHIEIEGVHRQLREDIQVKSITTDSVRRDLKWHTKNLKEGYYDMFPKLRINETYTLANLRSVTQSLGMKIVGSRQAWTVSKMLDKLKEVVRFDMLNDEGKVVKQKPKCTQIRVVKEQLFNNEDIFELATPRIG